MSWWLVSAGAFGIVVAIALIVMGGCAAAAGSGAGAELLEAGRGEAVAIELAGRPGARWVCPGQQLEELVDAALAGPQGVAALRRELGLEWAGV